VPEGDYTLRAYTAFMQSLEEHYLFTGPIRIGDPQAGAVAIETDFFFESERRIHATFSFSKPGSTEPFIPEWVKVSVNQGRRMEIKVERDGKATINFNLPANSSKRVMLLEAMTARNVYRSFIQVPVPDSDFDVAFYPEGGSLLQGTGSRVVFKAMKSNGQSANISGVVYDNLGNETGTFKSDYLGMGTFLHLAEKGKTYHAVCENEKGQSKRFDLPAAIDHGYALSVNLVRENLYVSVLQPAGANDHSPLHLIALTRGVVHFADTWDRNRESLIIRQEIFPSGVLHLVLFNNQHQPVSERLLFINNRQDQAQVSYQSSRESFAPRSLVQSSVTVTDSNGEPLTGSFSVSVTSDNYVTPDTTADILTQLLLTSDLRGHIEHPAFYFQNTSSSATYEHKQGTVCTICRKS
jgi:hypothetical protein